jgi:hypothetical protein
MGSMARSIATLNSDEHKFQRGTILLHEETVVEKGVKWYSFRWPDGSLVHLKYNEFTWGLNYAN